MKKQHKIIMLRADSQVNQVEVANKFINCPMYEWDKNKDGTYNVFHLLCERVTKNGHAWVGSGIRTDIQHLYVISDDEIQIGDWCYSKRNIIGKFGSFENSYEDECKKVIATTDPKIINDFSTPETLFVPSIPQSFIEEYCKSNGEINTVKVEYIEYITTCDECNHIHDYNAMRCDSCNCEIIMGATKYVNKLKLTNDNEIIISKIKDSWTKEEIFELLDTYFLNSNIVSQENREIYMDDIMDLF